MKAFRIGLLGLLAALQVRGAVLDAGMHHLGVPGRPEWKEFADDPKVQPRLDLSFQYEAQANREDTLLVRQSEVKLDWKVEINGKAIGKLFLMEDELTLPLRVPPGTLRSGSNTLSIIPPREADDITVGGFELLSGGISNVLNQCSLSIEVSDGERGLPCRLTIVDQNGVLAAFLAKADQPKLAVRPGVVYSLDGRAELSFRPGQYTIYATRGMEFGLVSTNVQLQAGAAARINLKLSPEVQTSGYASCDTHIHTWTFSRHGDATLEERIITLAGEGIEAPATTDHNLIVDYRPAVAKLQAGRWFTLLPGDEITTSFGHFNAFPFQIGEPPPSFAGDNWVKIIQGIRSNATRFVILNHPRDLHSNFRPFAPANFNGLTGENLRGFDFTFDGMEIINSGALQSDWRAAFRDWFALLNHGDRIVGIAGSDSHDVSRFIVGQGRTYIRCNDSDPGKLDPVELAGSLRSGHATFSMGLYLTVLVESKFAPGDLATNLPSEVILEADVQGPSWSHADTVELFANGQLVKSASLNASLGKPQREHIVWRLPKPKRDEHWIVVASGPGVTAPYWRIPHPYQPTSTEWMPHAIAASNPIWLDGDGDGHFTPPKDYAQRLIEAKKSPADLAAALRDFDEATATQAAALWRKNGRSIDDLAKASAPEQRKIFEQIAKSYGP